MKLAPCQCSRWWDDSRCHKTADAEDLLCEACRNGCIAMWYCNIGSSGGRWAHVAAPVIAPEDLDWLREVFRRAI